MSPLYLLPVEFSSSFIVSVTFSLLIMILCTGTYYGRLVPTLRNNLILHSKADGRLSETPAQHSFEQGWSETISSSIPKQKSGLRTPPVQRLVRAGLIPWILWTGTVTWERDELWCTLFWCQFEKYFFDFFVFCSSNLDIWFFIKNFFMFPFFFRQYVSMYKISVFKISPSRGKKVKFESCQKRVEADETSLFSNFLLKPCTRRGLRVIFQVKRKKYAYPLESSISKLKRGFLRPRFKRIRSSTSNLFDFFKPFLHIF